MSTPEQAIEEAPNELAVAEQARRERLPIPSHNGLLHPDRWAMFGRIANTVADTEFVPKGLRGNAPAVMACLLYGDAQGLHPSVALTEIHIVDGKPTMSATLMVGKIRMAGHRIKREEIYEDVDGVKTFVGCVAHGTRSDDGETDSFRFDLRMAARAGLLTKHNWRSYPESMCWARCVSQLARMLFPDVFLGQSAYTGEELGLEETDVDGMPLAQIEAAPVAGGPEPDEPREHVPGCTLSPDHPDECVTAPASAGATMLEVRDEDGTLVGTYTKGTDPFEALNLGAGYEIVGVIEHGPGGVVIREKAESVEGEVVHQPGEETHEADGGAAGEAGPEADSESREPAGPDPGAGGTQEAGGDAETPLAPGAQAQIASLTIPKVMEAVAAAKERGDVDFIRGVLDYEKGKPQPRARLVTTLEELLDELAKQKEAAAADERALAEHQAEAELWSMTEDGNGEQEFEPTPPAPEPEPEPDEPAPAPAFVPGPRAIAPVPEPARRLAVLKVRAVCAWMEEHKPEEKSWRYEAIVAAAAHIYGKLHDEPIHTLDALTDEELEQVWGASPDAAREALAILEPADLEKLSEKTLGGRKTTS